MLKAQALACRRGKKTVFRKLGFSLEAGGLLLVTGPNGSGKSSLLRLLAGMLPAFAGEIIWDGAAVTDFATHRSRLRYIGHLDAVKPELRVDEVTGYWQSLEGSAAPPDLDAFGLAHLRQMPARHLSAGQKRRLSLTRLTMTDAPLWLLDEPTTALDEEGRARLAEQLARHRQRGGLAVVATHSPEVFEDASSLTLGAVV